MDPACARLGSLVMMHLAPFSPLWLEGLKCPVSWSDLTRKKFTLVMKPNKKGVCSALSNPSSMELSRTGMIWKKSGIIPSTLNSVSPPRSTPSL